MGVGSYLSRFVERQLVAHFLRIELLVGLIGGLMPAALFALHSVAAGSFRFALYSWLRAGGGHARRASRSRSSCASSSATSASAMR